MSLFAEMQPLRWLPLQKTPSEFCPAPEGLATLKAPGQESPGPPSSRPRCHLCVQTPMPTCPRAARRLRCPSSRLPGRPDGLPPGSRAEPLASLCGSLSHGPVSPPAPGPDSCLLHLSAWPGAETCSRMRVRRTGGHTAASALRVPLRAEALCTSGPSQGGSRGPRPGQPLGLGPADRVS